MSSQVVILFLYGGHSVHVAVAEFHDSAINLSCLSDISDFPTLDQIHLRNVAMRQVRVADVFVDSVFIMVYNHGLS